MSGVRALLAVSLLASACAAGATGVGAVGPAWWFSEARPCRWSPTLAQAQRSMRVFEGVVVDDWNELVLDGWSVRLLRHYRFQVLRDWSRHASGEAWLVQGWSEGEWYMSGTYRTFQRDRRYLIASVTYDSPPHSFATSCFPGATDGAIPELAAKLGPPVMAFEPKPAQPLPLRLRLERDAANLEWFATTLRHRALDLIAHAWF